MFSSILYLYGIVLDLCNYIYGGSVMEYTDLEYFIAIAEHHNLTRAAEALYVSQPTLTKYLHKLEKELGGKVFRRNGYQYDLTFLGQQEYWHSIRTGKKSFQICALTIMAS